MEKIQTNENTSFTRRFNDRYDDSQNLTFDKLFLRFSILFVFHEFSTHYSMATMCEIFRSWTLLTPQRTILIFTDQLNRITAWKLESRRI